MDYSHEEGTEDFRIKNIKEMQKWSLEKKIEHSLKRIREFFESREGNVYIATSGGKDSRVLEQLVRSIYPDVVAVFSNTTNEYVEILKFVKTIDNLITVYPRMNFKEVVRKHGFPLVSKKVARQIFDIRNPTGNNEATRKLYLTGIKRDGSRSNDFKLSNKWMGLIDVDFEITNKCCDILKKEPLKRFERESGLSPFVGVLASESSMRKSKWLKMGCNTVVGSNIQSRPLSIWNEDDIWAYIKKYGVTYSKIYDDVTDDEGKIVVEGEVRTGCAYCAYGAQFEKSNGNDLKNRFERLKVRKPHQYKKMMALENKGVKFSEALDFINIKN